jgi:hypothetical protein
MNFRCVCKHERAISISNTIRDRMNCPGILRADIVISISNTIHDRMNILDISRADIVISISNTERERYRERARRIDKVPIKGEENSERSFYYPDRKIRHVYGPFSYAVSHRKRPYTAKLRLKIRLSVIIDTGNYVQL